MKNKVFLGLAFFLVGSALAGCGNSGTDAKTVEAVRLFAASMQKDTDDFNDLIYQSVFREKYSVAYQSEDNSSSTAYSLSYHAEGDVLSGYSLNADGGVTPTLIYNRGTGYFAGRQQETVKLSHTVTDKNTKEKRKNTRADYALSHVFGVQFNGNELYAMGKSNLTNNLNAANSTSGEFAGKIAKSALYQYGEDVIETAISRILYLDAWSNISLFQEATVAYFQSVDLSTDDKVKQFVNEKKIQISETDENYHFSFVLDGGKILSGLTGKDLGISATVAGTALINKKTKFVAYSDYNFKDLFLALLQKGNAGKTSYDVSVDSFSLRTVLTSYSASEKKLEGTFTEYPSEQKAEFMNRFKQYVVPSVSDVEIEG